MKSPYISPHPDNDSPLVIDIHAGADEDRVRIYVDRKLTAADCRRLAQTLLTAADAADSKPSNEPNAFVSAARVEVALNKYRCRRCGNFHVERPCGGRTEWIWALAEVLDYELRCVT